MVQPIIEKTQVTLIITWAAWIILIIGANVTICNNTIKKYNYILIIEITLNERSAERYVAWTNDRITSICTNLYYY